MSPSGTRLRGSSPWSNWRTRGKTACLKLVKGRDYPRWSSRFERGFSQLVDWAWRIDQERQPSATLEAAFGTADPRIHYLLVIGRDRWIGAAGRARLDWRHRHNGISGERTTIWTYDDLFSFVNDRLAVAEQDALDLARLGQEGPSPRATDKRG
jgi:antiviral defense system Shedu protein SduA